jgi:hypothetical protein
MSSSATSGALANQMWKAFTPKDGGRPPALQFTRHKTLSVKGPAICKIRKINLVYMTHQF